MNGVPSRPHWHLTAHSGWLNDPLGLTWHEGAYHLFFQYVPGQPRWSPHCHWGHATSTDLLHWEEQPVALAPGDGDDGVWSGCVVDGRIFYTSVTEPDLGVGRVRVAVPSDDSWTAWTKGPVVAEAPGSLGATTFRDPFVFRDGPGWRMLVGAGLRTRTAAVASYSSGDLDTWAHDGIALSRSATETEPEWTGSAWECPQLLRIGERYALIVSVWDEDVLSHVAYAVGDWADGRFRTESWGRLSHGPGHYAASVFEDRDGHPGLICWLRGIADPAEAWAGALSIPYRLTLEGATLCATPHPNLSPAVRLVAGAAPVAIPDGTAALSWEPGSGGTLVLAGVSGEVARLQATPDRLRIEAAGQQPVDLPGGPDQVQLVVDQGIVEVSSRVGICAVPLISVAREAWVRAG